MSEVETKAPDGTETTVRTGQPDSDQGQSEPNGGEHVGEDRSGNDEGNGNGNAEGEATKD